MPETLRLDLMTEEAQNAIEGIQPDIAIIANTDPRQLSKSLRANVFVEGESEEARQANAVCMLQSVEIRHTRAWLARRTRFAATALCALVFSTGAVIHENSRAAIKANHGVVGRGEVEYFDDGLALIVGSGIGGAVGYLGSMPFEGIAARNRARKMVNWHIDSTMGLRIQ
ncbi:MAG TPA: hypothetical protein VL989_02310 [Candidatus Sulfotelmatobacter sp.]|nr:hypothetical protein [Candidatus Sulfotelmatobacter sp.]